MNQKNLSFSNCKNCGAPVDLNSQKCSYCQTPYLFGGIHFYKDKKIRKSGIYPVLIGLGLVLVFLIYFIFFNNLSETVLVQITPVWFFLIVFGLYGYHAEKVVEYMVINKLMNFGKAFIAQLNEKYAHIPFIILILHLIYFPFSFFRSINPLSVAFLGSFIWGILLFIFFSAIFPAL